MPGSVQQANRIVRVVTSGPVWHGTSDQARDLASAVAHNCACEFGSVGDRIAICSAHQMIEDQRMLDGLIFGRYMVARLRQGEFDLSEVVEPSGQG